MTQATSATMKEARVHDEEDDFFEDAREMVSLWQDGKVRCSELAEKEMSGTEEDVEVYEAASGKKVKNDIFDEMAGSEGDIFDDDYDDFEDEELLF